MRSPTLASSTCSQLPGPLDVVDGEDFGDECGGAVEFEVGVADTRLAFEGCVAAFDETVGGVEEVGGEEVLAGDHVGEAAGFGEEVAAPTVAGFGGVSAGVLVLEFGFGVFGGCAEEVAELGFEFAFVAVVVGVGGADLVLGAFVFEGEEFAE